MEEQIDRRREINTAMNRVILQDLQQLIHEHHALVRLFKTALERMPNDDYKVVIRADKRPAGTHERTFNAPIIDEVAILIVGENLDSRDIVITRRDTGQLKQIYETHRSYDCLQYPLMFWQGDDGYHFNIKMINPLNGEYQYRTFYIDMAYCLQASLLSQLSQKWANFLICWKQLISGSIKNPEQTQKN